MENQKLHLLLLKTKSKKACMSLNNAELHKPYLDK